MFVFFIIALAVIVMTFFRMLKKDLKRWKELRLIQDWIREFNTAFEQCKDYINKDIDFVDSNYGNEEGKFEIDLGEYFYIVDNTQKMREYLNGYGNDILDYEKELIEIYGEMTYKDIYVQFLEGLKKVRQAMIEHGEKLN